MLTPQIRKELDKQLDEHLGQLRKRAADGERIPVRLLLDVLQARAYLQLLDADVLSRVQKRLDMLDQIDQAEAEAAARARAEPEPTQPPDEGAGASWEQVEVLGHTRHIGRVWQGWQAGETWLFIHVPDYINERRRYRERRIQVPSRSVFRRQWLTEEEARESLKYNTRVTDGDALPAEQLYGARTQLDVRREEAASALGIERQSYDAIEAGYERQDDVPQLVERLVAFFRAEQTARGVAFEKESDGWAVTIGGKRYLSGLRSEPEAIAVARSQARHEQSSHDEASASDEADDNAVAASDEAGDDEARDDEARRRSRQLLEMAITTKFLPLATRAVLMSCWAHASADEVDAYNAGQGGRPRVQLQAGLASFAGELGVSEKQLRNHLKTLDRESLITWQGGDTFELISEAERIRMQAERPQDAGDDQVVDQNDGNDGGRCDP